MLPGLMLLWPWVYNGDPEKLSLVRGWLIVPADLYFTL